MPPFHFHPFPALSTQRLFLRRLVKQDDNEIFLLRSNELVNKYLERTKASCIEEAQEFIEKINEGISNDQCMYWAICFRNEEKLIGTICLWNFSIEHNKAEIGYELLPEFHGKGIMQEAFAKVINYGFAVLKLRKIEACTIAPNIHSIKILERNHFKRDAELEAKLDPKTKNNEQLIYSLSNPVSLALSSL